MTLVRSEPVRLDVLDLHDAGRDAALVALAGDVIGVGVFRKVFEVRWNPTLVLKVEIAGKEFCNAMEWQVWAAAQGTPAEKWLAPCVFIDHRAGALIQKRTQPMTERVWKGLELPDFFDDVQPKNWGLLSGKPVCHDYAMLNNVLRRGLRVGKLVKPGEWFDA